MKITNHTHWRSDQLRAIISRIAKDELADLPERRKRLTIEIVYTRPKVYRQGDARHYVTGCALVGGTRMTLRVGKEGIDKSKFALVVAHELAHIRGLKHNRINGRKAYDWVDGWREYYTWAEGYPIEQKAVEEKPRSDVQQVRYQRTLTNIARWEAKLKRATNALRKLRVKRRYYERALAAKDDSK